MADLTDLETKKSLVRKQTCFSNLNPTEIDVLVTLLTEITFNPGDVIVKEGDHVDSVYIIVHGSADVVVSKRENDKEVFTKVASLKDGNAIGLSEHGFYSLTGLRTATVTATTELLALKLSVVVFRGFALAYPHASEVMRKQAESL